MYLITLPTFEQILILQRLYLLKRTVMVQGRMKLVVMVGAVVFDTLICFFPVGEVTSLLRLQHGRHFCVEPHWLEEAPCEVPAADWGDFSCSE